MNATNIICSCGHTATKHKDNGCNFVTKSKEHPYECDEFCECDITDKELFVAELAQMQARMEKAESNLRFYDGLIIGDGDHDKIMLARDGAVFLKCFQLLDMDISGASTEEIPDAIERLKQKLAALKQEARKVIK